MASQRSPRGALALTAAPGEDRPLNSVPPEPIWAAVCDKSLCGTPGTSRTDRRPWYRRTQARGRTPSISIEIWGRKPPQRIEPRTRWLIVRRISLLVTRLWTRHLLHGQHPRRPEGSAPSAGVDGIHYPLEVVDAARFAHANPNLTDKALDDALQERSWDASVKSLISFPQVLAMMNEKLDWTQKLGNAFLAQQKES